MDISTAFGQTLKKWRRIRMLTQVELASRCKLDRTFISLLERGLRQPSLTTIFDLSVALKVPASELVHQTERTIKYTRRKNLGQAASQRL